MRALLMALVLAGGTPALANPSPLYVRAIPAQVETPAPRVQAPVVLKLAMREREERPLPKHEKQPERPSFLHQLRDRIYEELPVVSIAVVSPLPISSADGTLAGVGVVGTF